MSNSKTNSGIISLGPVVVEDLQGPIGTTTPNNGNFTTITSFIPGTGSKDNLRFGLSATPYNCGQLRFNVVSPGSSTNYMSLCSFGGVPGINVDGSGQVAFPQLVDGILQLTGNILVTHTLASLMKAPTSRQMVLGDTSYTPPTSPAPVYIRVEMVGGGGGGAGSGVGGGAGGNGGSSTWLSFGSTNIAAGGFGASGITGGDKGINTINFPCVKNIYGAQGCGGGAMKGGTGAAGPGGAGGGSYYGGGGGAPPQAGGQTGVMSGAFGSGGSGGATIGTDIGAAGGGGAGFLEFVLAPVLVGAYTISVGAGGAGGASGTSSGGGPGNNGVIYIYEYYQ